jgi:hypothetical protein
MIHPVDCATIVINYNAGRVGSGEHLKNGYAAALPREADMGSYPEYPIHPL